MMKRYKVIVQNQAKEDVKDSRNWYNQRQKGLGKRFTGDLRNTLSSIANNPTSFAVRYGEFRKASLLRFPYGVFFFIDYAGDIVYIIAIKHNSRDFGT